MREQNVLYAPAPLCRFKSCRDSRCGSRTCKKYVLFRFGDLRSARSVDSPGM